MAITLSGISNDILSTTIYEIKDEVAEGLFETTPFLSVASLSSQLKPKNIRLLLFLTLAGKHWTLVFRTLPSRLSMIGLALRFLFLSLVVRKRKTAVIEPLLI